MAAQSCSAQLMGGNSYWINQAWSCRREKAAGTERLLEGGELEEPSTLHQTPTPHFPESRLIPSAEEVPSEEQIYCKAEKKQTCPRW